jgi:hypothetical protein
MPLAKLHQHMQPHALNGELDIAGWNGMFRGHYKVFSQIFPELPFGQKGKQQPWAPQLPHPACKRVQLLRTSKEDG